MPSKELMCELAPNARPSVRTTYPVIVPSRCPRLCQTLPQACLSAQELISFWQTEIHTHPKTLPVEEGEFRWESRQFFINRHLIQFHQTPLGSGKQGRRFLRNAGWYFSAALDSKGEKARHQLEPSQTNSSTVGTLPLKVVQPHPPSLVALRICIYKRKYTVVRPTRSIMQLCSVDFNPLVGGLAGTSWKAFTKS